MEPFRIEGIEVKHIGPFEELKMLFPKKTGTGAEIHILTGENGTGKSTILQLLASSVANPDDRLYKKVWDAFSMIRIGFFGFSIQYDYPHFERLFFKQGGASLLINVKSQHHYDAFSKLNDFSQKDYEIAFFAYSGFRNLPSSIVMSISELKINALENAVDFNKKYDEDLIVKWLSLLLTKMALRRLANELQNSSPIPEIYLIDQIVSRIIDSKVSLKLKDEPLSVVADIDGLLLEFDQLPDGLRSIISWVGNLVMRLSYVPWKEEMPLNEHNFILFLDEIEVHLHPAWQRKILPVLQQIFPNAQIFISTHSPFVIGSIDGAWVHQFEKKELFSVLKPEPMLSEDSYSYDYILREVFGIKERFGIEVEKQLARFRQLRDALMKGETTDRAQFDESVAELMKQSSEIQSIVGMELRQLNRILNQPAI